MKSKSNLESFLIFSCFKDLKKINIIFECLKIWRNFNKSALVYVKFGYNRHIITHKFSVFVVQKTPNSTLSHNLSQKDLTILQL